MTAAMTSLRTIALGALILAAASATPGAARADDTLATLARPAPVSAYGGRIAWSSYDAAQQNYAADDPGERRQFRGAGAPGGPSPSTLTSGPTRTATPSPSTRAVPASRVPASR